MARLEQQQRRDGKLDASDELRRNRQQEPRQVCNRRKEWLEASYKLRHQDRGARVVGVKP